MNSWEKAEAEVERRRKEKNAVKNRKKKEKKRLKKQQNLEEAAQADSRHCGARLAKITLCNETRVVRNYPQTSLSSILRAILPKHR